MTVAVPCAGTVTVPADSVNIPAGAGVPASAVGIDVVRAARDVRGLRQVQGHGGVRRCWSR